MWVGWIWGIRMGWIWAPGGRADRGAVTVAGLARRIWGARVTLGDTAGLPAAGTRPRAGPELGRGHPAVFFFFFPGFFFFPARRPAGPSPFPGGTAGWQPGTGTGHAPPVASGERRVSPRGRGLGDKEMAEGTSRGHPGACHRAGDISRTPRCLSQGRGHPGEVLAPRHRTGDILGTPRCLEQGRGHPGEVLAPRQRTGDILGTPRGSSGPFSLARSERFGDVEGQDGAPCPPLLAPEEFFFFCFLFFLMPSWGPRLLGPPSPPLPASRARPQPGGHAGGAGDTAEGGGVPAAPPPPGIVPAATTSPGTPKSGDTTPGDLPAVCLEDSVCPKTQVWFFFFFFLFFFFCLFFVFCVCVCVFL
ncbi:translation initiation factor IF-2-like [Onychostruthus taczanowskii]|uniref:translation initiation factor IF-2-like n=1 Tax=Onychostruthus taczanowskii TaxID=356909 RepID=UPI001B807754|nr:translation initiation factor IF-2-like [Onychostruthus taczanowskii]